ncbi:MAG: 5-(carboxyamino)imidazole ribonucleotide synthase [Flavobacteriales bacterium]|jgi:5-(carboxyamino)imidazole ribonucleotide synthase
MKAFYSGSFRLGILGGGQLGRMFIQEAVNYDVRVSVLDPSADAPCASLAHTFVQGNFADYDDVYAFGKTVDLLTIEIEHVNVEALERLRDEGLTICPDPDVLRIIRDKGLQKQFYHQKGIPTAPFHLVENKAEAATFLAEFPFMQKLRKGGYDGKGVTPLRTADDLANAFDAPSVLEKMVPFEKELAVIVARNAAGEINTFPLVEMVFNPEANLVEMLSCPAHVSPRTATEADRIAREIAEHLALTGILAVELFMLSDGSLLVNEIAPRPHNSGHQTIEGNVTSQYEQHLRAILNLPLGDPSLIAPSVMVNVLGEKGHSGPVKYFGIEEVMKWPGVYVHLYGKTETRSFRKMGHVTVVNDDLAEAQRIGREVLHTLKVIS